MKREHVLFYCLIALSGCIDSIEVDLPTRPAGRLVVAGVVERSSDDYRFLVDVTRTQDLEDEMVAERENADIHILYNGNEALAVRNGVSRIFPVDSFHWVFGGIPNDATFNILVKTSDGGTFTSKDQRVLSSPLGANAMVRYEERSELNDKGNVVEKGYVKVFMNSPLINSLSERVSLRWNVSGVYRFPEIPWTDNPFIPVYTCFVQERESGNQINIANSNDIRGDEVKEFEVLETTADYRFSSGYYFNVIQKAVSGEAAAYWQEVRKGVTRAGTIFDVPAGQIRSNIIQAQGTEQEVLGYFYTAGVDTIHRSATRGETGGQYPLCAFANVSDACCDCLLLVNSSYDKPTYWVE